jgi:hypothetical protein
MSEDIKPKTHAVLGPSGADRWATCPGSVVLEDGKPDNPTIYAAWGTVAHEIAEYCLWDELSETPYSEPLNAESFVGRTFLNVDGFDIEVDMEMADCVNTYTATVHQYIDIKAGHTLLVEQSLAIDHITGEEGATGTGDVVGLCGDEIVVIDLKSGMRLVHADGNRQCTMYGDAALLEHDLVSGPFKTVRNVIVQPRKNHVSEECVTVEELAERVEELRSATRAVQDARAHKDADLTPYLNPSEKACAYCKAKATCPALQGEVLRTVTAGAADSDAFPDLTAEPQALPKALAAHTPPTADLEAEQLSAAMRSLPFIENWIKGIRAEVERRLFADEQVPGWGLFKGKMGNRKWTSAEAAEEALKAARLKLDEMYSKTVISPTQAEKLLKDDKPRVWKKLQDLITRTEGGATVDKADCGREPYTAATAEVEDFPDLVGEDDPLLQ